MMKLPRFFKRKECLVPTPWTWCAALVACALGLLVFAFSIQPFLAPVHPVNARILVVEGWIPNMRSKRPLPTSGPIDTRLSWLREVRWEFGHFLIGYKSLAGVGAATLRKLGVDSSRIAVVPSPFVQKDRTYEEAVSLKRWLARNPDLGKSLNLYSIGCHSRRSQLLYSRVLGTAYTVGIVASRPPVRQPQVVALQQRRPAVADETLACCYAFVFHLCIRDRLAFRHRAGTSIVLEKRKSVKYNLITNGAAVHRSIRRHATGQAGSGFSQMNRPYISQPAPGQTGTSSPAIRRAGSTIRALYGFILGPDQHGPS